MRFIHSIVFLLVIFVIGGFTNSHENEKFNKLLIGKWQGVSEKKANNTVIFVKYQEHIHYYGDGRYYLKFVSEDKKLSYEDFGTWKIVKENEQILLVVKIDPDLTKSELSRSLSVRKKVLKHVDSQKLELHYPILKESLIYKRIE